MQRRGRLHIHPGGPESIVAIAAGYSHELTLKADGTLAAWGSNIRVPQMSECALGSWMELCLAPAGYDF